MTLTDFLLARIADQIALAREVQAQGVTEGLSPDDPRSAALRLAALSLAECEAKRRIVEWHADAHDCVRYVHPDDNRDCDTLRALAAPYADHPDYREEWRP